MEENDCDISPVITWKKTFFTEEKVYKLQEPPNVQNDRVHEVNKSDARNDRAYVERKGLPSSVMISAGISKLGKTSIHVVTRGVKINLQHHCHVSNTVVIYKIIDFLELE